MVDAVRQTESVFEGSSLEKLSSPDIVIAALTRTFNAYRALETELLQGALVKAIASILDKEKVEAIRVCGAGTSGRLAFLVCSIYRDLYAELGIKLVPQIAGGPEAIRRTVERAEDNRNAFSNLDGDEKKQIDIGITWGASAPAVGAVLKNSPHSILIAGNTIEEAPNHPLEGIHEGGMRGLLAELQSKESLIELICPVGAEPLAGSSRMAGGTATLVILDLVLNLTYKFLKESASARPTESEIAAQVSHYLKLIVGPDKDQELAKGESNLGLVLTDLYENHSSMSEGIDLFSSTIENGGKVYIIGGTTLGKCGVLDASECPPTFGIPLNQVQGFVDGGWATLVGSGLEDEDIKALNQKYPCDMHEFELQSSSLSQKDLVIYLRDAPDEIRHLVKNHPSNPKIFKVNTISVIGTKEFANALSTAAFAKAGYIKDGRMINVSISNNKLLARAAGIVADILDCSKKHALSLIAQTIMDGETAEVIEQVLIDMVVSQGLRFIVPKAVLLGCGVPFDKIDEQFQGVVNPKRIIEEALAQRSSV